MKKILKFFIACTAVAMSIGAGALLLKTPHKATIENKFNKKADSDLPVYGVDYLFYFENAPETKYKTINDALYGDYSGVNKLKVASDFTQPIESTVSVSGVAGAKLLLDMNNHTWSNAKINFDTLDVELYGPGEIVGSVYSSNDESDSGNYVYYSCYRLTVNENVTIRNTYNGENKDKTGAVCFDRNNFTTTKTKYINVYGSLVGANAIYSSIASIYVYPGATVSGQISLIEIGAVITITGGTFTSEKSNIVRDNSIGIHLGGITTISGGSFTSTYSNIVSLYGERTEIKGGTFTSTTGYNIDTYQAVYFSGTPSLSALDSTKANVHYDLNNAPFAYGVFGADYQDITDYYDDKTVELHYYTGENTISVCFEDILSPNAYRLIDYVYDEDKFEVVNTNPIVEEINGVEYTSQIAYIPENHTVEFYFDEIRECTIHTTTLDVNNNSFYPVAPSNTHFPELMFTVKSELVGDYTVPYGYESFYYETPMFLDPDYVKITIGGSLVTIIRNYMGEGNPVTGYYIDIDEEEATPRGQVFNNSNLTFDPTLHNANIEIWIDAVPLIETTYTNFAGDEVDGAIKWFNNTFPRITVNVDNDITTSWYVPEIQCDLTAENKNLFSTTLTVLFTIKEDYRDTYAFYYEYLPDYSDYHEVKINDTVTNKYKEYGDEFTDFSRFRTGHYVDEYFNGESYCIQNDESYCGQVNFLRRELRDGDVITIKIKTEEIETMEILDFAYTYLYMDSYGLEDTYGGVEGAGFCNGENYNYYYLDAKAFLFDYVFDSYLYNSLYEYYFYGADLPEEKFVVYYYTQSEYKFPSYRLTNFQTNPVFADAKARYEAWAAAVGDPEPYNPLSVPSQYKDFYTVVESDEEPDYSLFSVDFTIGDVITAAKDKKQKDNNATLFVVIAIIASTSLLGFGLITFKKKEN